MVGQAVFGTSEWLMRARWKLDRDEDKSDPERDASPAPDLSFLRRNRRTTSKCVEVQ